jgi:hypothetical protein
VAETVVINIEANTQGLQTTIDLLTKLGVVEQKVADEFRKTNEQNVQSLNKGVKQTTKEFEKLDKAVKGIKGDNQLAKSLDASKEIAKTGNSFQSLRQQFKEATQEVQRLAEQYGELDARTLAAAQKAGQLKDQIGDINQQIAALTPEGKFAAIQNLAGAIGGVFQVATGALQAFGVESEQATKIAQQFQGALNIFGGLSQLSQLKDSLTAVKAALGLTTAAQVVNTEATAAGTVATEAQVVANGAATTSFNVLKAAIASNPIGALAIAIGAVAGAFLLFADNADEAADAVDRLNTSIDNTNRQYDDEIAALQRIGKEQIDNIETRIAIRKTEGAGVKELADLEKQRIQAEQQALQLRANANTRALNEAIEAREKLNGLQGEDADRLRADLDKQIADRRNYNKDVVVDAKLLKNDLLQLEAETTANLKEENKKKAEDRANAVKANFDKQLKDSTDYYQKLRDLAKINSKDQEEFNRLNTIVTDEELRKQVQLYEKFGKDTTSLFAKIKENADKNPFIKAPSAVELQDGLFKVQQFSDTLAPIGIKYKIIPEGGKDLEKDIQAQADVLKEELGNLALTTGLDIAFQQLDKFFTDSIDAINILKDAQLEAITEEEEALNESYENRKIGKRELELEQERLTKQRVAAEKKAEKEIIEIKKKQDLANRAAALFNIGINTAVAITKTTAELGAILAAPLIPLIIAQGAIQAAAVIAQPLPKYKKGTLSVGGVGSEDTELALLQPGEAVIPTETNKRYHPAIKAIYHGKIKPDDINNFVNLKLRGDYSSSEARPVMAKMDTSDLYALGRIMKKNDGVYVKNIGELAAMIADSYNPRR